MDVRLWSQELIADFIELYKSLPCLWKVGSEEYKNRNFRNKAYKKMIKFCKERGFPQANRDFVVKKIQSLRGSYRKELKKVLDSKRTARGTAGIHTPSLWYFDLLKFTTGQELPTDSINTDDSVSDSDEFECEITKFEDNVLEDPLSQTEEPQLQPQTPTPTLLNLQPQKIHQDPQPQSEFFEISNPTTKENNQPIGEFDPFGVYVAKKLAKMEASQAIYAESLICMVIRNGLLNKLTDNSNLCENDCRRSFIAVCSNI